MSDALKHPVPKGRWASLQDEAFWVPMKGVVSRAVQELGLKPETAGSLIAEGMAAGVIAHKPTSDDKFWVVAPRGADLVRASGFSYDTGLDWENGCMIRPDSPAIPLAIYWPDVQKAALCGKPEKLAAKRPKYPEVYSWLLNYCQAAAERGDPPPKRDEEALPACADSINATYEVMKKAFADLPPELKRARGR